MMTFFSEQEAENNWEMLQGPFPEPWKTQFKMKGISYVSMLTIKQTQ